MPICSPVGQGYWYSDIGVAKRLNFCSKGEYEPSPSSELRCLGVQDGEDRIDQSQRRSPEPGIRTEIVPVD